MRETTSNKISASRPRKQDAYAELSALSDLQIVARLAEIKRRQCGDLDFSKLSFRSKARLVLSTICGRNPDLEYLQVGANILRSRAEIAAIKLRGEPDRKPPLIRTNGDPIRRKLN